MRLSFFEIKSKIYFKEMSMYNLFIKICGVLQDGNQYTAIKNITIMVVEKEIIFRVDKSHVVDE